MSIDTEVLGAARRVGASHEVAPAALLAVALVETNAVAFATVDGRREPLIRFEGHYFDRRLSDGARDRARAEGLADPRAGAVRNPASQSARWRLLDKAAAIDAEAAFASVSWGLGQVMGAHAARLGFADAVALAAQARSGIDGQLDLCARFLALDGLGERLRRGDFEGFSRLYNGPGFSANRYDDKIRAAWDAAGRALADASAPVRTQALARGHRGQAVFDLQADLAAAGLDLAVDGMFGPGTAAAVAAFQERAGLAATGVADPETRTALGRACRP